MIFEKKIHFCWFGNTELSENAKKCIASWKIFFPDYEIIKWDESNYNFNKIVFTREAYKYKKYAFLSDYARFDILYQYGGIYFDVDVEIIKPFGDILNNEVFFGLQSTGNINTGLGLGSNPGNDTVYEIIKFYQKMHCTKKNGTIIAPTVVKVVSDIMKKHGYKNENIIQKVNGITIYPTDYFCPMSFETGKLNITENTVAIHHFEGSWVSDIFKKNNAERWEFYNKYSEDPYLVSLFKRMEHLYNNDALTLPLRTLYKIAFHRTCRKFIKF